MTDSSKSATMTLDEIRAEAELLPPVERLLLADSILQTVDPGDAESERQWLEEVRDRIAAVRRGELQLVDANEVFAKLRHK